MFILRHGAGVMARAWWAVFTAVFGMLLVRNRFLFSTAVYELGDSGANSIIVNQAKHFSLLVGNYSRQGFNHPGPAYFYLQAAGEWLLHDVLGLVPTPWNGQLVAVYAINAAMLATVTAIIGRRFGSWLAAGAALFAMVLLIAYYPPVINDAWMPLVYVLTFLLLLVSTASVAGGEPRDLWAVALSAGLLVHGHAAFLLLALAVAAVAVIAAVLRRREIQPRIWLVALGIFLIFWVPIGLHTIADWPGEFGKYLGYGLSERAGSGSLWSSLSYVYRYWWPERSGWLALLGIPLIAAVVFAVARIRDPFVRAGLWICGLVTALTVYYAFAAVDDVEQAYMGFFYWAVPLFLVACLAARLALAIPGDWRLPAALRAALPIAGVVAVMAAVPGFRSAVHDDRPEVPAALQALTRHSGGRPIVVELAGNDIGMDLPGLANWARREGVRVCVRDPRWSFLTTPEFICKPSEITNGARVLRWKVEERDLPQPGELARVGNSAFTPAPVAR